MMNSTSRHITRIVVSLLILCGPLMAAAQEELGLTRDGNKLFDKKKYADAEASYKKALEKKSNFPEATFNLGDAIYKQERFDDAISQFELSAKTFTDPQLKAQAYHNLGNSQMEKKEYERAVDAYKHSLKLNPTDRDTKYNLAYANAKLKEKQKQDQQNKDQKKDQKDKEQQKKDQNNKDKKDNKGGNEKKQGDKQKDKGDGDKKDQSQRPGQQSHLTKEQADKLLEALKAEEQKAQEKMQKKTAKPAEVKIEKDW